MPSYRHWTLLRIFLVLPALAWSLNEGMATHFLGVGYPYGACGVSDEVAATEGAMDTLTGQANPFDYVALNVYHTPGRYDMPAPHPMVGSDTAFKGMYDNGRNCGRWIRFELGDTCDGTNDGAKNADFCRGGTGWHPNLYTGSGGYAIVFDQCTDGNAWCRDSRYHLDLHTPILSHLLKGGTLLPPLAQAVLGPDGKPQADKNNPWAVYYQVSGFLNPKVRWEFVTAPNYQGEPRFWFSVDSKPYYYRLMVTHLPDGLHGVEQLVGGVWKSAKMEGDMGQLYILPDPSTSRMTVRLTDAHDKPVMGGRTWSMDFPTACGGVCQKPATAAESVVGSGGEVGVERTVRGTAPSPRQLADGRLWIPEATDGLLELWDVSGRGTAKLPLRSGAAVLPPGLHGLILVRWNERASQKNATLVVR